MKIGDKVRFLNATGGGVVKGFKTKDIVLIEDEDGFEVPILSKECVVIAPNNEHQVRQSVQPSFDTKSFTADVVEEVAEVEETKEGELITVSLAYLPVDKKTISTTSYECYLINDSNYFLNYSYLSREDSGWNCRNTGIIEPNTKIFIEEFEKEDLNTLEKVCVQFFAYKQNKNFSLKNACSVELRIDTVKFYKLHSFKENDYFDEDALVYTLVKRDLSEKMLIVTPEELEIAMKEKSQPSSRPRISPVRKQKTNNLLEIDLHITELLDNTNGLDSADILDYQMTKFREVLAENKDNKGQKIVFIHGKGNGVLKKTILDELKNKYKSYYVQDASFREYGFGATLVTIK